MLFRYFLDYAYQFILSLRLSIFPEFGSIKVCTPACKNGHVNAGILSFRHCAANWFQNSGLDLLKIPVNTYVK